jgi:hypothetical protein
MAGIQQLVPLSTTQLPRQIRERFLSFDGRDARKALQSKSAREVESKRSESRPRAKSMQDIL